jgi:molecular chaperone GrpE
MENMRRRAAQEQQLQTEKIKKQIFLDLLPIIDNFERALQSLTTSGASAEETVRGISLIHTLLEKMLQKYGITEIKTTDYFNPELHEAIMHIESPGKESGSIIQVLEKGYMQNGSVLRPARVSVAK